MTPLDYAHAAMQDAPDDDNARLHFYSQLAGTELFLVLEQDPIGDHIVPLLFPVEETRIALVFDREDRLAQFTGAPSPYAALSGRSLVSMLAGQNIGLGVNLEVAPSAILLDADAVMWLQTTLPATPVEQQGQITNLTPPTGLSETVLTALDARFAAAIGWADMAYLVRADYTGDMQGYLIGIINAAPHLQDGLVAAIADVTALSGLDKGYIDVAFFKSTDAMAARLAQSGLRFDFPKPDAQTAHPAPGMNPDRPPILR